MIFVWGILEERQPQVQFMDPEVNGDMAVGFVCGPIFAENKQQQQQQMLTNVYIISAIVKGVKVIIGGEKTWK